MYATCTFSTTHTLHVMHTFTQDGGLPCCNTHNAAFLQLKRSSFQESKLHD